MNFGMQDIMKQAQKMQQELQQVQEEARKKTVTAEAGGGMISVTVNGANQILSIRIEKQVINPDEKEMLEDLIVAAVNKALEAASDMVQAEMEKVTSMLPNIPGLNLPF